MKVLIIGLGSIAKKHINALKHIETNVAIWALRSKNNAEKYLDVINLYSIDDCPEIDFVIIANPTSQHANAIKSAIKLNKPIFIEKPPFHSLENVNEILSLIEKNNIKTYTAFNLRFLESLIYLKNNLIINKIQEVNIYCGSYLPSWRNNENYKLNYSANASMGGGVHLDLIHELDYALWLFGKPTEIKSTLQSKSKLNIDAIDYANYALIYEHFVVNIILNYYRKDTKRTCEIVFEDDTWLCDLMTNSINSLVNNKNIFSSTQTTIETYIHQLKYFTNCIHQNIKLNNSLKESVETLKIALT